MGHLINPIAFRLSFFKSWEDTWFVKNIYYPEFLNGMLKLRNYIYYILTNKGLLKSGIFLSNFFILKYNKLFFINIYIYHIDYEKLSYSLINNLYSSLLGYGRGYKKKRINNFYQLFIPNSEFFMFIIFFYKLFYKKKKKKIINIESYINLNLFYKSNDLIIYYNKLLEQFNDKFINKYISLNKNEIKKEEKDFLLDDYYWQQIFFLNLKNNNYIKTYSYNEVMYGNFTLLEFIMFLLKKIKYNYKNKLFSKIIKIKYLISLLRIFRYSNIKYNKKLNFLLFYLGVLLNSIALNITINKNYKIKNKFYYILYESIGYKFFFKQLKAILHFLNSVFFILNKVVNVCYRFYFLSNRNITAKWLSRYIGLKLRNNYSFYRVLNPIKKELYKLCKLNRRRVNKFFQKKKFINFITLKNKYKLKFKSLIKNIFLIYIKENYLYYLSNHNFIYDFFLFLKHKIYMPNLEFFKFIKIYKYLYVNLFMNNSWQLNLLNKHKLVNSVINKIYNFVLINMDNKFNYDSKIFYISNFFIKNLFNFAYFQYIWSKIKHFNARNIRSSYKKPAKSALIGYKLAFKGRFSRKQRVSNIWYMHGKVPLNTLSVKLDYSFFTIPLKNSAISIKIILYKNIYKERFKYLLIF